ncbi:MAG: HAD-IA family hydrolase [Gemmataceae bacterium]|nr:HAD-IA family hydrolase [Gemmata sp.]MDW8197316.1 HAD-IA family hydrolase [Gemmataceae bacterium]
MTQAILFDFDGTLADSFAAITASTNHVRNCYGLPPLSEAEVRQFVGYGLVHLMTTLVPGVPVEEAVARYREHHPYVMMTQTRLMPGVAETLPQLAHRGYRMAVCSNKRVEFTQQLVTALGLKDYFACILGPDDVQQRAKPDPAMLLEALNRLKVSPQQAVYVGDMVVDVQTARAAGVPVWLILPPESPLRLQFRTNSPASALPPPDRILDTFTDLLRFLSQPDVPPPTG